MKVSFRKELDLKINMHRLMRKCVRMLTADFTLYNDLEVLVYNCLELLYDVNLYGYDNTDEVITVVTKNLLLWCLESNHIKEYNELKSLS